MNSSSKCTIKFLEEVLDQKHHIKVNYVKEKKWDNMIIPDVFYYRDAAWLYEYLDLLKTGVLEVYHFEYGPTKEEKINLIFDDIEKLVFNLNKNVDKYTILTNPDKDFLIYKFQCEDYFMVFGNEDCVEQLTKCSHSVEKKWFLEWMSSFSNIGKNKAYSLWQKYKGTSLVQVSNGESE